MAYEVAVAVAKAVHTACMTDAITLHVQEMDCMGANCQTHMPHNTSTKKWVAASFVRLKPQFSMMFTCNTYCHQQW